MKFIKAYEFDKQTKEYIGDVKVQQDLLNPGTLLFPPCVVLNKPPEKVYKKAIVWDQKTNNWKYINDHREEYLYNKENSKIKIQIKTLFYEIPEEYTNVIPPDEIKHYKFKNNQWEIYIKPITKEQLYELTYQQKCKVAYGSINILKNQHTYIFSINKESISNITSKMVSFLIEQNKSVFWKVYENNQPTLFELSKQQFKTIYIECRHIIEIAFKLEGVFNAQIKEMTNQQLNNINYITQFKEIITKAFSEIKNDISF